jgi:hypothetical protein
MPTYHSVCGVLNGDSRSFGSCEQRFSPPSTFETLSHVYVTMVIIEGVWLCPYLKLSC